MTSPLLSRLKDETRVAHERVERRLDLDSRLASHAAFARLLARLHGFYDPIEAALGDYQDDRRRKANWIREDLSALGWSTADIAAIPRCESLPAIRNRADAAGCQYVLEGATLGGQVIRRAVADRLGLRPGAGCSFFAAYGDRVGAMWNEFRDEVEANPWTAAEQDQIVETAQLTFLAMDDWIHGLDAPTLAAR